MDTAAFVIGHLLGSALAALIIYLIFGGPLDRFRDRH